MPVRSLPCLAVLLTALLLPRLAAASPERRVWAIGDELRLETPVTYRQGEPFTVTIEVRRAPAEPQRLGLGFNHLKAQGAFGGFLQSVAEQEVVTGPVTLERRLTIQREAPGLTVALLTVFLSPDGTWARRTVQAVVPLLPEGGDRALYDQAARRVAAPASQAPAPAGADVEDYTPRTEYFTQRALRRHDGQWRLAAQPYPPLAGILAAPPAERAPFGIYAWVEDYLQARDAVVRMGVRTVRLSGPWDRADEALRHAAEHGIEVLFTLMIGRTGEEYRAKRRPAYPDDASFVADFAANVGRFARRYGPGGDFERETGLRSPVAVLEFWNEPNLYYMIPDSGDRRADNARRAALYPQIVEAGARAAREAAPGLKIAAFAAAGVERADVGFIEAAHRARPGLTAYYDILSTHPYSKGAPPEAYRVRPWGEYSPADSLAAIRALPELVEHPRPVWYTEVGWEFARQHGGEQETRPHRLPDLVTPDLTAAYVVRLWLLAPRLGVERVHIMYLFDADSFNAGFLARSTGEWRPAAHAARHLNALLPRPRLVAAPVDGVDGLHVYRYQRDHAAEAGGGEVTAVWNVAGPRTVEVEVPGAKGSVIAHDLVGNRRDLPVSAGTVKVEAGPYPVFLAP